MFFVCTLYYRLSFTLRALEMLRRLDTVLLVLRVNVCVNVYESVVRVVAVCYITVIDVHIITRSCATYIIIIIRFHSG